MMESTPAESKRKWYSGGRWAWAFGLVGIAIVIFVAVTEGRYYAWLLWIAIPYLMISLGYAFLVHAIPVFLSYGGENQSEDERDVDRERHL